MTKLGEIALQRTKQNEKRRENEQKEARENAVRMEEAQQEKGKADKNKPITLH